MSLNTLLCFACFVIPLLASPFLSWDPPPKHDLGRAALNKQGHYSTCMAPIIVICSTFCLESYGMFIGNNVRELNGSLYIRPLDIA